MMNDKYTPRPTEYDGTVFRSKCEAIFARTLSMARYYWEYEPIEFKVGDWVPDFRAVVQARNRQSGRGVIWSLLIEYKPSEPTETYKSEILKTALKSNWTGEDMLLVYGSSFNSTCYTVETINDNRFEKLPQNHSLATTLNRYFSEAAQYRFDLRHAA